MKALFTEISFCDCAFVCTTVGFKRPTGIIHFVIPRTPAIPCAFQLSTPKIALLLPLVQPRRQTFHASFSPLSGMIRRENEWIRLRFEHRKQWLTPIRFGGGWISFWGWKMFFNCNFSYYYAECFKNPPNEKQILRYRRFGWRATHFLWMTSFNLFKKEEKKS